MWQHVEHVHKQKESFEEENKNHNSGLLQITLYASLYCNRLVCKSILHKTIQIYHVIDETLLFDQTLYPISHHNT